VSPKPEGDLRAYVRRFRIVVAADRRRFAHRNILIDCGEANTLDREVALKVIIGHAKIVCQVIEAYIDATGDRLGRGTLKLVADIGEIIVTGAIYRDISTLVAETLGRGTVTRRSSRSRSRGDRQL
jgi:hypothetical protein